MTRQSLGSSLTRHEVTSDQITTGPLRRLAAMLDHRDPPWKKDELPPLGHWLFHLNYCPQSELRPDGHSGNGGFAPPVSLTRRMWAGSRIRFLRPITVGSHTTRRSRVADVATKIGADGEFLLVMVRHEIICEDEVAIEEEQDLAYLTERTSSSEPRPPIAGTLAEARVTRLMRATPELLFRFSALTFNAHRIHYDRDYARDTERYPGLVVQGPLLATLLVDLLLRERPGTLVNRFRCRALAPVFECDSFNLCSRTTPAGGDLWVLGSDGELKMTAQVETDSAPAPN